MSYKCNKLFNLNYNISVEYNSILNSLGIFHGHATSYNIFLEFWRKSYYEIHAQEVNSLPFDAANMMFEPALHVLNPDEWVPIYRFGDYDKAYFDTISIIKIFRDIQVNGYYFVEKEDHIKLARLLIQLNDGYLSVLGNCLMKVLELDDFKV